MCSSDLLYNRLKYVRLIGENTYAIMMHHILGFLLLNAFLYAISVPGTLLEDFDRIAFFTDIGYLYHPNCAYAFKWVYLAAGLGIPLAVQYIIRKLAKIIFPVSLSKPPVSGS